MAGAVAENSAYHHGEVRFHLNLKNFITASWWNFCSKRSASIRTWHKLHNAIHCLVLFKHSHDHKQAQYRIQEYASYFLHHSGHLMTTKNRPSVLVVKWSLCFYYSVFHCMSLSVSLALHINWLWKRFWSFLAPGCNDGVFSPVYILSMCLLSLDVVDVHHCRVGPEFCG